METDTPGNEEATLPESVYASLLKFVETHIAFASGAAIICGIILSSVFLFSYLSIFDWHLIWFAQYVDFITFGVIAVGILGGSILIVNPYFYLWMDARRLQPASRRRWLIGTACLVVVLIGLSIWGAIRLQHGYFHIVTGVVLIGSIGILLRSVLRFIDTSTWPNGLQATSLAFLVVLSAYGVGQWLGYEVLESPEFDHDVVLKSGTLTDAKLVIVMARFTVLLKDKKLYVIPTRDISEFRNSQPITTPSVLVTPLTPSPK